MPDIDLDAIETMTSDPYQYAQVSPEVTRGYLAALLAELRATTADLAVAVEVARERGAEVERLRARICEHAKCPGGSLCCCDHPDVAQATADLRARIEALRDEWRAGRCACLTCTETRRHADALDALLRGA